MSSLLQHKGKVNHQGVGLIGYKQISPDSYGKPAEEYTCETCGRNHPVLYEFFRKPRGMFGCWVVFMYNGKEQVPDLSTPLWLDNIPRGSRKMSKLEATDYWHSE